MPTYLYRAVDLESRKQVEGAIDAPSDRAARAALHARGVLPLAVGEAVAEGVADHPWVSKAIEALTFRAVKPVDLMIFVQQFAALLGAGISMVEAMVLLEEQTESPTLRGAIAAMRKDLLGGLMLSEALSRHPRIFPPLFIHLAAAGELSGDLDIMIERMAEMLEKNLEIERKVKGAMAYPAMVGTTLMGVVIVLLTFVVPAFSSIYGKAGAALPLPTQMLLAMSATLRYGLGWVILLVLALVAAYRWYRGTPKGRLVVDAAWIKVPVIGPLLMHQAANMFTRAFGTVYGAGVPIVPALESCRQLVLNAAISEVITKATEQVRHGATLASGLEHSRFFPTVLAQMIAIGESSGQLEKLAVKAVTYSDKEIDFKIKQMTNLMEPLLTLVMGLIVMFIALALYLPMFDLPKLLMKS